MSKPPAFQFYPKDWLSDVKVRMMTLEQRGCYIDLLSIAWIEGGIPADVGQLRRLLGISPKRFTAVWEALAPHWQSDGNGRLINPRQERGRAELEDYQRRASAAGQAGAKARWSK